jgi:hypothetical protein
MWLGLALAALIPRAVGALVRQPWHDEYFTAWVAGLPWARLVDALRIDSGPPLPYALAKVVALSGLGPLPAARIVAVVAGTAAVLLAARATRLAFGTEAGWWTGALLAFHPLAVAWSAEGRAYALLLFAAAWAWERLESVVRGAGGALGLGLAVAIACWSHALGMLVAAALAIVGLSLRSPARRRVIVAVLAGFATCLAWLPVAIHQPPAAIAWMGAFWRTLPAPARIVAPLRLLSPVGGFSLTLDLPSSPWWIETVGALLVLALLAAGCGAGGAARRTAIAFLGPAAALWVLATLGVPAFYPGRGEVVYLVPFAALLGAGAVRSPGLRTVATAVGLAAVTVTGCAISGWVHRPPSPEQRLTAALRERLPEGGEVVIGGYWRLGLSYHLGAARSRFVLVNYPASAAAHPGWYDPAADRPAPGELDGLLARLHGLAARTAIVVTPGLDTAVELRRLAVGLGLRRAFAAAGGELFLPPA